MSIAAIVLNIFAFGLTYLVGSYNEHQKHIPQALTATDNNFAPAADAPGKAQAVTKLDKTTQDKLAQTQSVLQKGKFKPNPRHVKTLDEGRSATNRTYLNEDGTKTLETSVSATSYKDNAGKWQDVDVSLEHMNVADNWTTKANSWRATFKPTSTDTGLEISRGAQTVRMHPIGSKSVKPTILVSKGKQIVVYEDAWPGVDLRYSVYGSTVKESIWIKSKTDQNEFKFSITGGNLSPKAGEPGTYSLDGELSDFTLTKSFVSTASDGIIGDDGYVSQRVDQNAVTVKLNSAWLNDLPGKAYPVVIDPSFVSYTTTSTHMSYKSDGYYCNALACGISTGNTGSAIWRAAVNFPYSTLNQSGILLVNANLYLEMVDQGVISYPGTYDPRTVTASLAVPDGSGYLNYNSSNSAYGYKSGTIAYNGSFDVTSIYSKAIANNYWGMYLMLTGDESQYSYKFMTYPDAKVTFTYTSAPGVSTLVSPGDKAAVVTTQPTLKASSVTDPDGDAVKYRFNVTTTPDASGGSVANSGWLDVPQWTVPDNSLQDGVTYYWKVQAWDSQYIDEVKLTGSWSNSTVRSFHVDLRNGKDDTQAYDEISGARVDLATGNLSTGASSHSISALGGSLGIGLDYNSPQRSRPGLVGEYWNDPGQTLTIPSTAPHLKRVDGNIDGGWVYGSPDPSAITADNFLARWTGYFVAPTDGTYTFKAEVDDRCRLWVNSSQIIDSWSSWCGIRDATSTVTLAAGQVVPIKMETAEITGGATSRLWVRATNSGQTVVSDQVVPNEWLQTGVVDATEYGLTGRYYSFTGSAPPTFPSNENDPSLFLTRTDTLTQWWNNSAPVSGAPSDKYMVRWKGYFTPTQSDTYTFQVGVDDGVRMWVDNNSVLDKWSDTPGWYPQTASGISMTAGQSYPIVIEYYENLGSAGFELQYKGSDNIYKQVPQKYLTPQIRTLPEGWNLGLEGGSNISYDYAVIGANSITLRSSTGANHEYKWNGTGYTPPSGEAGQMARNSDGSITFQDADGRTYVFNSDGTLQQSTTPGDDRNPAALQYTYSGTPARLTQITDSVDPNRWAKLHYWGDSGFTCPTDTGFNSAGNYLCQVETSDGQVTNLYYNSEHRLSRTQLPGDSSHPQITDFGYLSLTSANSCPGCLSSIRDSLANDAISYGQRVNTDTTIQTDVAYDALGRVSGVTLPAPTVSATRQAHTYNFFPAFGSSAAYTLTHVANATEPNGFSRKVIYDSGYRTTEDRNAANLATTTEWDVDGSGVPRKDLVLSTTDPTGLKSTTIYDDNDRPTDQYGPAPSAWFGTDRKPVTTQVNNVPHTQTGYDESIPGLASAYYDVASASSNGYTEKLLLGVPKIHTTGVGPSNGDVVKNWGSTQPIAPTQTSYGWGVRLTGSIKLPETGNHAFRIKSDDGARLWIDDTLMINDWSDHGTFDFRTSNTANNGVFNNTTANSWHRIRIDYYNKAVGTTLDTDGHLELYKTAPGGTETSALGSLLTPDYGLATTNKVYDSSIGDTTTTNNYGSNPELGMLQGATVDPSGLNYSSSSSYEAPGDGNSYLRQTSKSLPGASSSYQAPTVATSTLLDEGLVSGWADWSWGSTSNFNDTTAPLAGTKDTAWTINTAWSGLNIHKSSGFNTTPYNALSFAIKATTSDPQLGLTLRKSNDAQFAAYVDISNYASDPAPNGYVTYNVPLSVLGGVGKTIYGVQIEDLAGGAHATVYLDALKFTTESSSYTFLSEGLHAGYGDWSWGSTIDYDNTSGPDQGLKDTAWTIDSGWAGLQVQDNDNKGVNTKPYSTLNFALKAPISNPNVGIQLTNSSGNGRTSEIPIWPYASAPDAQGYRLYSLPLSVLGASNVMVYGFVLSDLSGSSQAAMHLDGVRLSTQPANYTFLNEGLTPGWDDWSWSSTNNFLDTSNPNTGALATSWTINQAESGLSIGTDSPVDTKLYTALSFAIKTANGSIPDVVVSLMDAAGEPLTDWLDIASYAGSQQTNGYRVYTVPLTKLGAANRDIYAFGLQDASGSSQAAMYVDNVMLTKDQITAPGSTTYDYWKSNYAQPNPCVVNSPAVSQAGRQHYKNEPDPDGAGPLTGRITETIYDAAGRVVATRYNADPWTCATYDSRGRITQVVVPTINGRTGRTVTKDYAVGGNPLVTSTTDSVAGTASTTTDLLGRATSSTDTFGYTASTTYDTLGRVSQQTSLKGTEVPTYDSLNRVTGYALDGTTYATLTYDSYGRVDTVEYPQATNGTNKLKLSQITRDSLQRVTGSTFTFADLTTLAETVGLSAQKGMVTSDSFTKGSQTAGAAYTYDTIGRLTQATVDNWQYQYAFGAQQSACSNIDGYNPNADKNGNRTSYTVTNTTTSASTTSTSCYNAADQLATSTDTQIGTPTYDDHGNITQLAGAGAPIVFTYDASDQNTKIKQGNNWTEYTKSSSGAVLIKKEYRNNVLDKVYRNAGGVMLTCNTTSQSSCTTLDKYITLPGGVSLTVKNGTPVYSIQNFHGDTAITVAATGLPSTSVFLYDPFGQVLSSNTFGTGNNNLSNASDNSMGWAANPARKAESMFSIPIVEMGARVYLPTLGRFTSVDPVEGGNDNAYSYVNDPVNDNDYSGQFSWGTVLKVVAVVAVVAVAVAACIAACAAIAAGAAAAAAAAAAYAAAAAATIAVVTRAAAAYVPRIAAAVRSAATVVRSAASSAQKFFAPAQANIKLAGTSVPTSAPPTAGVYRFTASSGADYIGKSVNVANRIEQHAATGKYPGGPVSVNQMTNANNLDLRIMEQIEINAAGGPAKLDNKINSIASKFWDDLNIPPPTQ